MTFKQSLSRIPGSGAVMGPLKGVFARLADKPEDLFSILHCAFSFPLRVSYAGVDDLEQSALADYLLREEHLASVVPTEEEASIIEKWFPRDDRSKFNHYQNFEPRHGGGFVAEGTRSSRRKYTMIGTDPILHYLDNKLGDKATTPRYRKPFERRARVIFVAKTATKLRTICMEPTTLMWYQQGFLRSLEKYVSTHSYLKRRIDFKEQEKNRDLAAEGSLCGDFATIDLQAASDSVSWNLVKRWFRGSFLRETVFATRSNSCVLPDGRVVPMQKYAPMGSALCFPMESIVFCAITEAAIKQVGGNPAASRYRVYGDDIIVERRYVDALIQRLVSNGFTVNNRKSYTTGGSHYFRESCGGEYLNCADVTPIRIPRRFRGIRVNRDHPESIAGLIEFANDCYVRLPSVRRRIVTELLTLPTDVRPLFDGTGEGALFSTQPTNFHLRSHYCPNWQRDVFQHGVIGYVYPGARKDEDIRLFEYLRLTNGRSRLLYPEDRVDVRIDPPSKLLWVSQSS